MWYVGDELLRSALLEHTLSTWDLEWMWEASVMQNVISGQQRYQKPLFCSVYYCKHTSRLFGLSLGANMLDFTLKNWM